MVEDSFSEHEDRPVETTHNKGKRAKSMKRKKKNETHWPVGIYPTLCLFGVTEEER